MVNRPEASSSTRPRHKVMAETMKQSSSRAAATVEAAKIAMLEAAKKKRKGKRKRKRKRKKKPTLTSQDVKKEDETTDDPLVIDNCVAPRSPSPATKRRREVEQQVTEEDLHIIREAQVATIRAQVKMATKVRARPPRPKLRTTVVVR
jgi:hypothetical protein